MFAQIRVSSKRADAWPESKGKRQEAIGEITNIGMGHHTGTGDPLLWISVNDYETRGTGERLGETRDYEKTGTIYLDKEAVIVLVKHAFENSLITVEDIHTSNLALLDAALRVERARLRRKSKIAA